MHDERIKSLDDRVSKLEGANRRLALACIAMALGAIGLLSFACGPRAAEALRAQRIEIVDARGEVRGLIFADQSGAAISLDDGDGNVRLTLAAARERPGLEIFDTQQRRRLALTAEQEGATLAIADENGTLRATIGLFRDEAWLAFLNAQGEVVHSSPAPSQ